MWIRYVIFFVFLLSVGIRLEGGVYYIDYEKGNDYNPGTKERPFKHHPWDIEAEGVAKSVKGIHTYYFKKGVIYRGRLIAKDSGKSGKPIKLTVDPEWGEGKAMIYGSERITGGWKRCTEEDTEIPEFCRDKVWYIDLDGSYIPQAVWEIRGDKVIRVNIARNPNWEITNPDDPHSGWWEWTGVSLEIKMDVESTEGFEIGDRIEVPGYSYRSKIIDKGKNWIKVLVIKPPEIFSKKFPFKEGVSITNGRVTTKIRKVYSHQADIISVAEDSLHLTQRGIDLKGATVWSELWCGGDAVCTPIWSYNPETHEIRAQFHRSPREFAPRKFYRYFLENHPAFLDSPNEFYYERKGKHPGRLYIRLKDDYNPNNSIIEVAKYHSFLEIYRKKHIVIDGLEIRFFNNLDPETLWKTQMSSHHCAGIILKGENQDIKIQNCFFEDLPNGISGFPFDYGDLIDNIEISHNEFRNIEGSGIWFCLSGSYHQPIPGIDYKTHRWFHCVKSKKLHGLKARLKHVWVKHNLLYNCGFRNMNFWRRGAGIHIDSGELVEVAYNKLDRMYRQGINVFVGSPFDHPYRVKGIEYPLMRVLIHHNQVTNSLLDTQDYGGIEAWMGGPVYIYNNISGNAVGYKHSHYRKWSGRKKDWYRTSCYGPGIYLDGQYKGYVFNNIVWGKNNNVNDQIYNSVGINEAMGFMHVIFNNTIYNCGAGLHKGMYQHNRCYYLNNLFLNIGNIFIIQTVKKVPEIEYTTLGYASNIFQGSPTYFGQLGDKIFKTIEEWKEFLEKEKVIASETGIITSEPQVEDAKNHNFKPRKDSLVIDRAKKVFVPWALYKVVGEWGFYKYSKDPRIILGENLNWNKEYKRREMFQNISRHNLIGHNIDESNYKYGILENWVEGALKLNGIDEYCELNPSDSVDLDMDTNNFLIEAVIKGKRGCLVCKVADGRGYSVYIGRNGKIAMKLLSDGEKYVRESKQAINDNKYHHVVLQVDRSKERPVDIFIDGKVSNGRERGRISKRKSLSNESVFLVGKGKEGYFAGEIDFLRVSRGTLADAETTIEELYNWEFNGPFLRDFYGRKPAGKARDIGAIEWTE
ncbi:MAG TPA: hypothetical protein ENF60_01215 [Candidatus Omnitrophica bacterium]|nr:hypothetical protein [Candidatus Omnitrophota bacterium]